MPGKEIYYAKDRLCFRGRNVDRAFGRAGPGPVQCPSSDSRMANSGSVTDGNTTITAGGASDADLNIARYKAWDDFQSSNPELARQMRHNPRLIRSQSFVGHHAQLKQLFEANSGMQQDMERNPGNYMARMSASHRHHRNRS